MKEFLLIISDLNLISFIKNMSIKLFGPSNNPRVCQIHLVADLLEIPVESVEVGYDQCQSKEHLARNPFAKVPAI